ncbi:peptidylprolyl isomerase [Qipengyuania gaetbuli]|uniref:peptidylprolyl isomerase n=1 Tax=Qipengyuania gaetbuli TaxID=266952 RepID=UPI001CD6C49B|nr:peptidylprolyl isomerase [Qipengyuania gaetbuli]MCA0909717.1 peptidylprolyl isomerase [Qipengyuania gaetbuli]
MTKHLISLAAMLALAAPLAAQEEPQGAPSPNEIVAQADAKEWIAIPAEDLLVMTLAPAADGSARKVVIQLMPAPFSQGWVENIRTLARAKWYDNIAVNRVQDNYVVQWGDPNYDNPESEGAAKPLPDGLKVMDESDYAAPARHYRFYGNSGKRVHENRSNPHLTMAYLFGNYAGYNGFSAGWPVAGTNSAVPSEKRRSIDSAYDYSRPDSVWPVHCYGMVGVGRNYSPDTGSGAELYTVIGHAPRHLDRNIALVGRIVEGMEHLSSLPRGTGALGFYATGEEAKRTPILSVRVASDLPAGERPAFEYLSTEGETFVRYAEARANRRDPFFIVPAGGADICNIPVPIRRAGE